MGLRIKAIIEIDKELPIFEQEDEWRAIYRVKHENGKTIIEIDAKDSVAFRAIVNELARYFIATEKVDSLSKF